MKKLKLDMKVITLTKTPIVGTLVNMNKDRSRRANKSLYGIKDANGVIHNVHGDLVKPYVKEI